MPSNYWLITWKLLSGTIITATAVLSVFLLKTVDFVGLMLPNILHFNKHFNKHISMACLLLVTKVGETLTLCFHGDNVTLQSQLLNEVPKERIFVEDFL